MTRNRDIALVVDDSPESLGMVATALEDDGMTVLVARDGKTGIDLARRLEPDVILMDAVMPELDGFETCRILKSGTQPTPAPVIFMTGLSEPEHIVRGLKSGGVDYLTKPVVVEELMARIAIHLVNARMIQSTQAALDKSGRAVIAFDQQGQMLWSSPKANDLISGATEILDATTEIGQALRLWLLTSVTVPLSQHLDFEAKGLRFKFLGLSGTGETVVRVMGEIGSNVGEALSEAFDLTPREGEVLYWLTMGKTNRDIAQILTLSARTVNKHLETVFQKMGVDNRTTAAVMADRILHQT